MSILILRIIAILAVTIDHIGALLEVARRNGSIDFGNLNFLVDVSRQIGRIAFPIFAFTVAQELRIKENIKKNILFILAVALLSMIPFSIFYTILAEPEIKIFYFHTVNVAFTFFFAAVCIYLCDLFIENPKRIMKVLYAIAVLIIIFVAGFSKDVFRVDYGSLGVILVILFYLDETKLGRVVLPFAFLFLQYARDLNLFLPGLISILVIFFFKESEFEDKSKWIAGFFYPLHLLIFSLAYIIILT